MSYEKTQTGLLVPRTPTQRKILYYVFFSFLQIAVCITCVILQAKSEENADAREIDEEFEGTYESPELIISCSFFHHRC